MFSIFKRRREARAQREAAEREHDERLAEAEYDLMHLQARGENAVRTLNERHSRNHWRESIERMIQGAH